MSSAVRRLFAHVTLAIFVVSLGLPLASKSHLRWDDDLDCGSGILAAGHPHQQLDTPAPSPAATHCALCHWLRAVASAAPVPVAVALPGFVTAGAAPAPAEVCAGRFTPLIQSSRAPPSLSL